MSVFISAVATTHACDAPSLIVAIIVNLI
jgi:hypothetical protein